MWGKVYYKTRTSGSESMWKLKKKKRKNTEVNCTLNLVLLKICWLDDCILEYLEGLVLPIYRKYIACYIRRRLSLKHVNKGLSIFCTHLKEQYGKQHTSEGFSGSASLSIWVWQLLVMMGCPKNWMFSSTLDSTYQQHISTQVWQSKLCPVIVKCEVDTKLVLVRNHCTEENNLVPPEKHRGLYVHSSRMIDQKWNSKW